jgi:hypothetical protein
MRRSRRDLDEVATALGYRVTRRRAFGVLGGAVLGSGALGGALPATAQADCGPNEYACDQNGVTYCFPQDWTCCQNPSGQDFGCSYRADCCPIPGSTGTCCDGCCTDDRFQGQHQCCPAGTTCCVSDFGLGCCPPDAHCDAHIGCVSGTCINGVCN